MFNKDGRSIAKGGCRGTRGSAIVGKHDRWYCTWGLVAKEICRVHVRKRSVTIVILFSTIGGAGD